MNYSYLQYFLWLISGSEISALRECENEYNRHANIGLMILITSLFAFFTAFIAGITFIPNNLSGVIAFASVWAVLIFSIDRSMVNSIKKDPNETTQPFWSFFIPRLILALILAFFMSIPLDHIVFPEAIERQMKENNQADWLKRKSEMDQGLDISKRETTVGTMQTQITALRQELESECPLTEYKDAVARYDACATELRGAEGDYIKKKDAAANYYNQLSRDPETNRLIWDDRYRALRRSRDDAYRVWNDKKRECSSYDSEAKKIASDWRAGKQDELSKANSRHEESSTFLENDKNQITQDSGKFKTELENMTGFDTKFVTLFLIPSWGVQVLKWAIFLALLVIEILPTYLKLKTPVGQYDRKMQEREDIMANEIRARVTSERTIAEETEGHRAQKEVKLNKSIINKVASIELKLAQELLEKWEENTKEQLKKNLDEDENRNNPV